MNDQSFYPIFADETKRFIRWHSNYYMVIEYNHNNQVYKTLGADHKTYYFKSDILYGSKELIWHVPKYEIEMY